MNNTLRLQKLEQANLVQGCKFIDALHAINKSVDNEQKLNNNLLHAKFFIEKAIHPSVLMENQLFYLLPWSEEVLEKNSEFFYENTKIFGELDEEDVNMFRDVWTKIRDRKEDKAELWAFVSSFLELIATYQSLNKNKLFSRFIQEKDNFLTLVQDIVKNDKIAKEKVEAVIAWQTRVDPELLCAKMTCAFLCNYKSWEKSPEFFIKNVEHAVFGQAYDTEEDTDETNNDIEELNLVTADWLKAVWKVAKKNEEDLQVFIQYLSSFMQFSKSYFGEDDWENAFRIRHESHNENLKKQSSK